MGSENSIASPPTQEASKRSSICSSVQEIGCRTTQVSIESNSLHTAGQLDKSVGMHVVEHQLCPMQLFRTLRTYSMHFGYIRTLLIYLLACLLGRKMCPRFTIACSLLITKFVNVVHVVHYLMDAWYSQNARDMYQTYIHTYPGHNTCISSCQDTQKRERGREGGA